MSDSYELSTKDRMVLLSILPSEGSITTVRLVRKLREALSFSEEEHKALKFRPSEDGKTTFWDAKSDIPKTVEIGSKMKALICEQLTSLSKEKKLQEAHLGLFDRFMDEEEATA